MKISMKIKFTEMNSENYAQLLERSLNEFYPNNQKSGSRFLEKYKLSSSLKQIIHCSLVDNTKEIASCVLVESTLKVGNLKTPIYFMTQVVTVQEFRGKGLFRYLVGEVEKFASGKNIPFLVVIARRSVKDLYWKVGFRGFSHFPEFCLKDRLSLLDPAVFELANIGDAEFLHRVHTETNAFHYGIVERTVADWETIIRNQSRESYQIYIPKKILFEGYFVAHEDRALEIGISMKNIINENLSETIGKNFQTLQVDHQHPVSNLLDKNKWNYSERFESREGHLIKMVSRTSDDVASYVNEITKEKGLYRLNIGFLDQW